MLLEMHIEDFAIIDQAYLEFDGGLNVFTGETGAGKTLIVNAVNMLLGDRADTSLIRSECQRASIEGLFSLQGSQNSSILRETSFGQNDEVVIARELLEGGKSKCYINGKIVNVNQLSLVGEELVDLHGQHQHQSLLNPRNQLAYLDAFGGAELLELKSKYEQIFSELNEKKSNLERLVNSEQESARKQDLLTFQIDEITKANFEIGEEEDLENKRQILIHSEKLHSATGSCLNLVLGLDEQSSNALDLMRAALSKLVEVKGIDKELDEIYQSYESLVYTMEEFAQSVRRYRDKIEFEPLLLNEVEARSGLLSLLKKKYGNSIKEILAYKAKAQEELDIIGQSDEQVACLSAEIARIEEGLTELACVLSVKRTEYAKMLQAQVQKHLSDLNMPKVRFEVLVSQESNESGLRVGEQLVKTFANGIDNVNFLIAPNPGEPIKPLNKIASGGELSRIMLALKIALTDVDDIGTFIFDEVDAGIGGKTAFSVGQKLAQLALNHQVICITHLPQIACFADRHFFVYKEGKGRRTLTSIKMLDDHSRLNEIARMLSGEAVSEVSKRHAAETIQKAANLKKDIRKGKYAVV